MKPTLKVALLATVLMVAAPVLAADMNTTTDANGHVVAVDANGNPVHHKHWHHHHDNGDAAMNNKNYINHDANPNYAAVDGRDGHRGYRDADGKWHAANDGVARHGGYRDADGVWHDANGNNYVRANDGRQYAYNDYYNRTADGRWMGINFESRHMTDGSDTDANNRGRHAFIFDNGQNAQDFRVGSGHVVKF